MRSRYKPIIDLKKRDSAKGNPCMPPGEHFAESHLRDTSAKAHKANHAGVHGIVHPGRISKAGLDEVAGALWRPTVSQGIRLRQPVDERHALLQ